MQQSDRGWLHCVSLWTSWTNDRKQEKPGNLCPFIPKISSLSFENDSWLTALAPKRSRLSLSVGTPSYDTSALECIRVHLTDHLRNNRTQNKDFSNDCHLESVNKYARNVVKGTSIIRVNRRSNRAFMGILKILLAFGVPSVHMFTLFYEARE